MAINSNQKSRVPRREAFKREITLISRGYSNPVAWPGGKITVYPWDSSVDEFLVEEASRNDNRQTLLFRLIEKLCNLNGGRLDEFVADETNTILLVARALAGGGVIKYTSTCPACRLKRQETIKVPDDLGRVGEKAADYPGFDVITLPENKDVLEISPLLIGQEINIIERGPEEKALMSDGVARLAMRIRSVGGGKPDTRREAAEYYLSLSPVDAKYFEKQAQELSPHLDTEVPHVCDACKKEFTHIITFDQEFFR